MFLKKIKIFHRAKASPKNQRLKTIAGMFFSYLFKDKVRFFVFLLVIDMVAIFYIFNQFVLPVVSQSGADVAPIVSKKVKIKKDLYNELIKTSDSRAF